MLNVCSGNKGSSLKGMFEKAAANRKTAVVKKEESSSVKKDETSPGKENRINEEKERKASKENGVASKKRSKKDSSSSVNKRRRIQVMSDSDSDGSEGGDVNVEREEEEESQSAPPQAKLIQSDSGKTLKEGFFFLAKSAQVLANMKCGTNEFRRFVNGVSSFDMKRYSDFALNQNAFSISLSKLLESNLHAI